MSVLTPARLLAFLIALPLASAAGAPMQGGEGTWFLEAIGPEVSTFSEVVRDWAATTRGRLSVSTSGVGPGRGFAHFPPEAPEGSAGSESQLGVAAAWWFSNGARYVGVLALIGLGFWFYRWQILRQKHREQELRKRIDESHMELKRSESRYRKLFERNLAGVVRATVDGRILDCNRAFARIFGYSSREECRLKHRLRFGENEEHEAMLRQLREHVGYESTASTRDGSRVTLLWNAHLVLDETAEGLVIEGTVIDISERQRIEERLRREQKLESLETLAGGIAHDFNNLLVGILGNAELARMDLDPDSPVREYLADIEQAAHRAASLSQKMLAYSGKGRFVPKSLDLSHAIEDALPLVKVPKTVRLERNLHPDLPLIEADISQVDQLFSNLITNAVEAISEEGEGTVTLTTGTLYCDRECLSGTFFDQDLEEGHYVFAEVCDDGPGIDPEIQPKIFDPFFTTRFPGRGLGLPVVLGIMRGHRGALEISSEPSRGTKVRVLFPAAAEVTAAVETELGTETWRGSGRVLLVDDEAMVRNIAQQMLKILGFEVLTASDGDEGVELYRLHQHEIVLVLLDLTMPRMSGEAAFHKIRSIRPDARVILVSGYERARATESLEGLSGFIQKPYQMVTLRKKILRALARPT